MILEFISNLSPFEWFYDGLMVLWAVIIFANLAGVSKKFSDIVKKTNNAYTNAKSETKLVAGDSVEEISRKFDREKHEPIRADFTKQEVKYIRWANFISTLPIAGLLGTVFGLIPGLNAVKDGNMVVLYSALSTALSSTAIGLVASLVLKIYVSAGPDSKANEVEILFDQIDRRYDIAIGAGKVTK